MNTDTDVPTCPRCLGPIPDAEHAGQLSGPHSHVDGWIEICWPCDHEEFYGGELVPVDEWPVRVRANEDPVAVDFRNAPSLSIQQLMRMAASD
jgi:hypothetical protein